MQAPLGVSTPRERPVYCKAARTLSARLKGARGLVTPKRDIVKKSGPKQLTNKAAQSEKGNRRCTSHESSHSRRKIC